MPACLRLRLRFSRSSSRASPAKDFTPVGASVGRFIFPNTFGPERVSNLVLIFSTSSSSSVSATGATNGATTGAAGVLTTGAATSTATTGVDGASTTGGTSMGFSTTTGFDTTSLTGVSFFIGDVSTVLFLPMSIFLKIFGPANSSNFEAIFS